MARTEEPSEIDVAALIDGQQVGWFQVSVICWVCALMFIEGYDMQVVAYAAPSIIKAWHMNKAYFGPVFGFGLFGYMLGATLLSSLGDRFGRKSTIIGGVLLFGVFTLATAGAGSLSNLIFLRFMGGLGLGSSVPSAIALTAEYGPSRLRATMISVVFVGYTAGGACGGIIAAKFVPAYGWPVLFYIGGGAPIILGILLFFALPESVQFLALRRGRTPDLARILSRLRPEKSFSPVVRFRLQEEKQGGFPLKHLFSGGRAAVTCLLWFAFVSSLLALYFLTSWLPTLLVTEGMPFTHAAFAGALVQGGGGVGSLMIGWFLDRRGINAVAMAFILAAFPLVLITSVARSDLVLMPLVFVLGVCLIGGQIGLNAISGTIYPTFIRTSGAGWAFGVGRIGSIAGPVVGGILISFNLRLSSLFAFAAIVVLFCAFATSMLGKVAETYQGDRSGKLLPEPGPSTG
jgi:MFS transporter, AAHS family, 4-hydroxybenzoate transporter